MNIRLQDLVLFPLLLCTLLFVGCTDEPEPEPEEQKPAVTKAPKPAPKPSPFSDDDKESEEAPRERPDFENMTEGERQAYRDKRREEWDNMSDEEREARIAEMRAEREKRIQEMDTNNDGALGKDEVDERMWSFISQADKNGDNKVTTEERDEARAEREADRLMRELSGEEPDRRQFGRGGGGPGGKGRPGGGKGGGGDRGQ